MTGKLKLGCASDVDWIADVHRDDGKRFVVRADEKLKAFLELESGGSRWRRIEINKLASASATLTKKRR